MVFLRSESAISLQSAAPLFAKRLEGLIPAPQLAALRTAWAVWAGVSRTFKHTEQIPADEVADLCSALERCVPDLQIIFLWLSVSHTLHALTHHAPTPPRRFGSLGSYARQSLEEWHAFFNQAHAQCTVDSFSGSCAQLVQRVALERQPLAERSLSNGQTRKSAAAGAPRTKSPGDARLRVNNASHLQTAVGARKEQAETEACADGRSTNAVSTINAYKKRSVYAAKCAAALAARLAAETAAHAQVCSAAGDSAASTDYAAPAPAVLEDVETADAGEEEQPPAEDDILKEKELDPAVALMLG